MAKQGRFNMFKNAFVIGAGAGAGSFAAIIPQMLLGAFIFYIGSSMKEKGNKTMGTLFMILGAILMGNSWIAMSMVSNAVKN